MSYSDDEFWIWVKLSEQYEEAVLNKNPKFFDELYEKANSFAKKLKAKVIVENNDKELSRAYKYISSVARDGIDPNIRIKQ